MISYGQILKWQCPSLHSKDYDIIETMAKDIKKYRCRTSITSVIFQPIDIHDILFKPVVFKTRSSISIVHLIKALLKKLCSIKIDRYFDNYYFPSNKQK